MIDTGVPAGGAPGVACRRLDFDSDKARFARAETGRSNTMKMIDPILMELEHEAAATRRLLERVPATHLGWRPHAKSRSLGDLASHISVAQGHMAKAIQMPTYDFSNR